MGRLTKEMFERRLSPAVVARLYDDNNDGLADYEPVLAILSDAESKVDSYLAPLGILPLTDPYPREVLRLDMDVAVAYAAQRHPEAVNSYDWMKLMEQAEKDLKKLRSGETMLGLTPPDPPANHGGEVYNSTTSSLAAAEAGESAGFWDDMGDF